jgi:hypothetical protein
MIGGCGAIPEKTRELWVIARLSCFGGNGLFYAPENLVTT